MTFEQVMQLTRTISSPLAFDEAECLAYYELLNSLLEWSVIVEIGLQFGRSSSIAGQIAGKRGSLTYIGIDPFDQPEHPEAVRRWKKMMESICPWYVLYQAKSSEVNLGSEVFIDLALIDGDHTAEGVRTDCKLLKPLVKKGGYICFHDFDRESIPDVGRVAREELADWKHIGTYGTLGVFRNE